MRKPLPTALDIELRGGLSEATTAHAGVELLIDLGRRSGVMAAADKYLPPKKSPKGLGQAQMVESFVLLSALGGDCIDDLHGLRQDQGLTALLGYELPAAETGRQWLDAFHEPELLQDRPVQGSFIPLESARLAALGAVNQHTIRAYVAAAQPGPLVTLDVDAHLVESAKREALMSYEGFRGYQPLLVSWAETNLCWPTSSATAMCRPRSTSGSWSTRPTPACRPGRGRCRCAPIRPATNRAAWTTGTARAGASP